MVVRGRFAVPTQMCPWGIFGCFDVRVTSDSDVGFWLNFGWILVGFAKTPRPLFKVEILTSDFQRCINVWFSTLDQRLVFNVGPTSDFQHWINHTHILSQTCWLSQT